MDPVDNTFRIVVEETRECCRCHAVSCKRVRHEILSLELPSVSPKAYWLCDRTTALNRGRVFSVRLRMRKPL